MERTNNSYQPMVQSLTYEGDELFGHEMRRFPPLTDVLTAKGWWWQHYYKVAEGLRGRFYAQEAGVPEGYIILTRGQCEPRSIREAVETVEVSAWQIAVPLKRFFRDRQLSLHEQWQFIRKIRRDIPERIRNKFILKTAMEIAYEMDMGEEFMTWFYDQKTEDPKAFGMQELKIKTEIERLKRVVEEAERRIAGLRKQVGTENWPRRYDDWYEKFRQSEHYGEMSFARWCREVVRYCDGDPMSITANVVKEGHMANNISRWTEVMAEAWRKKRHMEKVELGGLYNCTFG